MANKQTRIAVLCEDATHYEFIREYLICRGFNKRRISPFPTVKESGKLNNAKVIKYYPQLVATYRKIKNYQNTAIIVMIDADNTNVDDRIRDLNIELDKEEGTRNKDLRLPDEKIAIFVPTRNIETWFAYIENQDDNSEEIDYKQEKYKNYKKIQKSSLAKESAKILAEEICRQGLDDNAPSSLHHACEELKRLQLD
ncbi:MAG: hypothetical protein AB4290_14575 [Spirulina sp.]